jgi:hypothetical protein
LRHSALSARFKISGTPSFSNLADTPGFQTPPQSQSALDQLAQQAVNPHQHAALPQPVVHIPAFVQPPVLIESESGAPAAEQVIPAVSSDDDNSNESSGNTAIMTDSDDDVALSFGRGGDPREFLRTVPIIQRALVANKDRSASEVKLIAKAISVCKPKERKVLLVLS